MVARTGTIIDWSRENDDTDTASTAKVALPRPGLDTVGAPSDSCRVQPITECSGAWFIRATGSVGSTTLPSTARRTGLGAGPVSSQSPGMTTIEVLLKEQDGVVSRRQALAAGLTTSITRAT
ncbi:hypothetical protein NPS01_25930 [Nocardioides psychrotolerans]|nr:hypothetical protein NPS01_25930 [Nocardioides psychrotolerans]